MSKRQAERYRIHAVWFVQWLHLHQYEAARTFSELNEQLMEYVEMLWDTDCELEVCGQTLSAVSYFLMAKGKLSGAWQLFGVWKLQEPPCRAAPMSRQMCLALAAHSLLTLRDPEFCLSLLVGFHGLLRPGEILKLRRCDFVFAPNGKSMVLLLGFTKGGLRKGVSEYVHIDCPICLHAARLHFEQRNFANAYERIYSGSEKRWRDRFEDSLQHFGLCQLGLRPYSLRRGGATELFTQLGSIDLVMERGRWRHSATAQIYLVEGAAHLLRFALSEECQSMLQLYESVWLS